jgi:hypothetical protein
MRTLLAAALIGLSLVVPGTALAAVQVGQPFPSDLFTTQDRTQLTGLRVDLPKPDCAVRPSDCADVDVLNTLDGFNIQPRISIPFSGPIDVSTVSSETVFLVGPHRQRVGINQVVWEPAANTLHVESDAQLAPDSRYLLIVTRSVRGSDGEPDGDQGVSHAVAARSRCVDLRRCRPRASRRCKRVHDAEHRRNLEKGPPPDSEDLSSGAELHAW